MTAPGASAYESWVLALRQWAVNPRHDLSGLPALQVDSLPPSAYERLIAHITAAQQEVMDTWQRRLERGIGAARTEQDYGRTLVELRGLLAHRLQLARHSGLPEQIRQALSDAVERDVRRLQQDLEDTFTRPGRHTIQAGAERLLRVVRSNSLTAILAPDFPLGTLVTPPEPPPDVVGPGPSATPVTADRPGPSSRVLRRRVVLDVGARPKSDTEH